MDSRHTTCISIYWHGYRGTPRILIPTDMDMTAPHILVPTDMVTETHPYISIYWHGYRGTPRILIPTDMDMTAPHILVPTDMVTETHPYISTYWHGYDGTTYISTYWHVLSTWHKDFQELMKNQFFCIVTQRRLVNRYLRFGVAHHSTQRNITEDLELTPPPI